MGESKLKHSEITGAILKAFFKVYNELGYGFVEARYAAALDLELRNAGRHVAREYAARVYYLGHEVGFHRLDMVVDLVVVVELKSTPILLPYARRQIQNYLKATSLEVGLLLHFGPKPKYERFYFPNISMPTAAKPRILPPWDADSIDNLIEFERQMEREAKEEGWSSDDDTPDDPEGEDELPTGART